MENVVTQLRGIERNTDIELSKDGGMLDLINMRYREDGSLEPMGQPSVAGNLGDGSIPLYIHYLPNGDANLICAVVSSGTKNKKYDDGKLYDIVWGHKRVYGANKEQFVDIGDRIIVETGVSIFPKLYGSGNILCVENEGDCLYFLFKDGRYIRQYLPETPAVSISQVVVNEQQYIEAEQYTNPGRGSYGGSQDKFPAGDLSDYLGFIKSTILTKTDFVYERILVMAAVRLFDGTYLAPSNIAEIGFASLGDSRVNMEILGINRNHLRYNIPLCNFVINAGIGEMEHVPKENLSLVSSLDVFAYKYDPYPQPKLTKRFTDKDGVLKISEPCNVIHANRIGEGILSEAHGFYLIGRARYEDGFKFTLKSAGKDKIFRNHTDKVNPLFYSQDRFVQEESFDWNKVIPVKNILGERYSFNSRTHLFKVKEVPSISESIQLFRERVNFSLMGKLCTCYVEDEYGDKILLGDSYVYSDNYFPYIYTSIPWAKKIIVEHYDGESVPSSVYEIPLVPHKYMPICYADYCDKKDWEHNIVSGIADNDSANKSIVYPWRKWLYPQHKVDLSKYKSPTDYKRFKDRGNIVRVSSVDNPIGFVSKTTYSFSGDVIGLSSMKRSPEEWHFAPYPLYVFTSKGVNALQQGDGDVAYSNVLYVSEEVLSHSSALVSTPIGVVYASRGGRIHVLKQESGVLSFHLDGYLPRIGNDKILSKVYEQFTNQLGDEKGIYIDTLAPEKFFSTCSLHYSDKNREIIVYNKTFNSSLVREEHTQVEDDTNGTIVTRTSAPYCYVYNIASKSWSKRTIPSNIWKTFEFGGDTTHTQECRCSILNAHDKVFIAYNTKKECFIFDWDSPYYSACNTLMITRPICYNTNDLVRVEQVALRTLIKPHHRAVVYPNDVDGSIKVVTYDNKIVESMAGCSFYILGSHDGLVWEVVVGKENLSELRDVVLSLNRSSQHKFYCFVLVGIVRSDTRVNYIESIVSKAFNNRLR